MRRQGGYVLVEALVASACAALAGAAAMALLTHGAAASARIGDRVRGADLARGCREALGRGLAGAFRGLEGATLVRQGGAVRHRLEPGATGVSILRAVGGRIEVTAESPSTYRYVTSAQGGPIAGSTVATLPPTQPSGVTVLATVTAVDEAVDPPRLTVAWAAADLPVVEASPPRALVAVEWLDYRWQARAGVTELARRRGEGNWQPVLEGLDGISMQYRLDADGDGNHDGAATSLTGPTPGIVGVRWRCLPFAPAPALDGQAGQ